MKMEGIIGVTVHNTDWIRVANGTTPAEQYTRATYNGNMKDVRVHYYVDHTCAWQNLPLDLSGWHAADGSGNGNRKTIAIECIMSSAYNVTDRSSEDNAARLAAALLKQYGLGIECLFTHTHWLNIKDGKTGTVDELNTMRNAYKMCPLYILPHWAAFKAKVLLNGVNVKEYNREAYFAMFSTVFQDLSFLPVTVAENITMQAKADMDMGRLTKCLQKAGIYEKIQSLPQGLDSRMIRSVFADAVEFSGGETQKLALARALYKGGAVLLLDEPTAALDPIAEQEMYLRYAEFSKEKSSVFISHRLASTRFCDRILLIENGGIAEEGTHAELMQLHGKYAELFDLQSGSMSIK